MLIYFYFYRYYETSKWSTISKILEYGPVSFSFLTSPWNSLSLKDKLIPNWKLSTVSENRCQSRNCMLHYYINILFFFSINFKDAVRILTPNPVCCNYSNRKDRQWAWIYTDYSCSFYESFILYNIFLQDCLLLSVLEK